jgi:hypothetical protein
VTTDFNAATWTTAELVADVFRACRLPAVGTIDYTPQVVLNMATQSLHDWAGHMISTAHDGRQCTSLLRAVKADAIDVGGEMYELPPMATADTLDALIWVDPVSNAEKRLEPVPVSMLPLFTRATDSGTPHGYAFMDGTVRIFPRPNVGGALRMLFQRRLPVLTDAAGDHGEILSAIEKPGDATQTRITLSAGATGFFGTSLPWADVQGLYYPYRTKAALRGSASASPTVDVHMSFADFSALKAVGDTLVLYGKSHVVPLPLEMRDAFTRQVSSRLLSEIGDMPISQAHDQISNLAAGRVRDMLSPRAKGQPQKIYNPNSIARGGSSGRRRWFP